MAISMIASLHNSNHMPYPLFGELAQLVEHLLDEVSKRSGVRFPYSPQTHPFSQMMKGRV